ncbi:MAG: serine hydrolase domain-containing protein [Rhodospirillaceae bacterium]|jgi:CubicO group peptidase (beta-lactamase class C family)
MSFKRVCAATSILFVVSTVVFAKDPLPTSSPEDVGMTKAGLDRLASKMRGLVDEGLRAGVVWGVVKNGKLVQLEAYGQRDMDAGLPMETDTVFRLYSQSRAVTAAAILTLVDEGKLGLDDPVANYLPEIGRMQVISKLNRDEVIATVPQDPPMTVRHLFNYTSGLGYARDWPTGVGMDQRNILDLNGTLSDMVQKFAQYPLLAQPGERWIYGFHSDVLGAVAEVASGRKFNDFLDRRLLKRLGMDDTGYWVRSGSNDRLATVYGPDESGALVATSAPASGPYTQPGTMFSAGGGLVSTVPDYLRFGQMILNGGALDGARVLKAGTVAVMTTNALTPDQGRLSFGDSFNPGHPFTGYGWGLAIGVRLPNTAHTVPGSAGDLVWGGLANTTYFFDPVENIVAVAMTQYLGPNAEELTFRLREGVYGALAK